MNINIRQVEEDKYGNSKENIFIAFDESEHYLGNGYVYPTINHHQTNETPYLLFMEISVADDVQELESEKIRQKLFESVRERAKALRQEKPELKCRFYAGFAPNNKMLDFYLRNGFEEDYSVFMEATLKKEDIKSLPQNMQVKEYSIADETNLEDFARRYNEIFVSPMDGIEFAEAQAQDSSFKNFYFHMDGELVGECSLREEEACGWIEILYVLQEKRGMGISKYIMNFAHQYFLEKGIHQSKLEVWALNRRAVKLYESCGYVETGKGNMFPGITI